MRAHEVSTNEVLGQEFLKLPIFYLNTEMLSSPKESSLYSTHNYFNLVGLAVKLMVVQLFEK